MHTFKDFFDGSDQRNDMVIADVILEIEGHHEAPFTQIKKWQEGGRFYGYTWTRIILHFVRR